MREAFIQIRQVVLHLRLPGVGGHRIDRFGATIDLDQIEATATVQFDQRCGIGSKAGKMHVTGLAQSHEFIDPGKDVTASIVAPAHERNGNVVERQRVFERFRLDVVPGRVPLRNRSRARDELISQEQKPGPSQDVILPAHHVSLVRQNPPAGSPPAGSP